MEPRKNVFLNSDSKKDSEFEFHKIQAQLSGKF